MENLNNLNKSKGRGTIIYTIESLQCNTHSIITKLDEALFTSIKMKDSLLLVSIYRSPMSSEENNNDLIKLIHGISQTGFT